MSSITTPTIANEPNIADSSNMAKNAPNSIANSLVPSASIGYKRKAYTEKMHLDRKFSSLNHLSGKAIEHSLPSITQFDKIINHCLKNNLDINDFITFNKKDSEYEEERQEQLQERLSETYISMVEVLEYTSIGEYDPSEPLNESGFSLLIAGGQETVHFDLDGEDDSYGFGGINQSHSEWEDLYSEYKAVRKEAHQIGVEVEFCGE